MTRSRSYCLAILAVVGCGGATSSTQPSPPPPPPPPPPHEDRTALITPRLGDTPANQYSSVEITANTTYDLLNNGSHVIPFLFTVADSITGQALLSLGIRRLETDAGCSNVGAHGIICIRGVNNVEVRVYPDTSGLPNGYRYDSAQSQPSYHSSFLVSTPPIPPGTADIAGDWFQWHPDGQPEPSTMHIADVGNSDTIDAAVVQRCCPGFSFRATRSDSTTWTGHLPGTDDPNATAVLLYSKQNGIENLQLNLYFDHGITPFQYTRTGH
jgi:hypothetical protein